ncbi:hypothetical protein GUITHDRAFT_121961 [Guillardia theta CCMP2712]|uniref:Uncharacterized protein n=1 Tax=Guillardia theta (strain CCMP2712) TaxID=905079 RepID=L1I6G4_GUITC|nr:hypothetical protein GUITHDRAFT_121961 [Guillardia theta CCMP2712]EKX31843.1 hypothetical protein GUITHDRAFT_121961 [Guillardia theta CCMP2712]|eukprot:XP_005818823.1 hypothetical protein GUITHDRAFT_121961 [Guillardia theta CCMP2712]
MSGCMRAIASVWVGTLRCTKLYDDKEALTAHAVNSLITSIEQLQTQECALNKELTEITQQIKLKRNLGAKALKPLLIKSKQKRIKLTQIVKKKESFEHHLDLLNNNELDQSLISTVKQTANAMKSLGLHKQVDDIDAVMADLEDTQLDIKEVTDMMSSRMVRDEDIDDTELQDELDEILGIDEKEGHNFLIRERPSRVTEMPKLTSSMQEEQEFPAVPLTG